MAKSLGIRKNPVKDQREQEFKQAALKVFSTKGYHKSTMAEIAMEAGFGKGTLYWYWKSKEELYFSLIQQMHEEILQLVEEAAKREGTSLEKLTWMGNEMTELYYRDRDFCKLSWKMRAEEVETFSPYTWSNSTHTWNGPRGNWRRSCDRASRKRCCRRSNPTTWLACCWGWWRGWRSSGSRIPGRSICAGAWRSAYGFCWLRTKG